MSTVHKPSAKRRRRLRAGLLSYLLRRVGIGLIVILLVAVTVFIATRLSSDPARQLLPDDATPEQYQALRHQLGLDQPIWVQFGVYVSSLARFDLGSSYWLHRPVADLIGERLPNTFELVLVAMTIALVVGVALGLLAARRAGGVLDQLVSSAAIAALSLPQFWLGALLIAWFAVQLKWLPTSGSVGPLSIILPATTFALASIGRIAQNTRAAMIDELGTQHILVAQAKGLPGPYLIFRHAIPNVAVPILTLFSYEFVYALAGYSVVVETVFAWPGIGFLSIQAIQRQDLLLVQGIVFVVAIIVVLVNIVTDLLYKLIDPRIEL